MDYSILPPELLILLAHKLNIEKYESGSTTQIFYSCYTSQYDPGIKQYYFPFNKIGTEWKH